MKRSTALAVLEAIAAPAGDAVDAQTVLDAIADTETVIEQTRAILEPLIGDILAGEAASGSEIAETLERAVSLLWKAQDALCDETRQAAVRVVNRLRHEDDVA